MSTVLVLGGTGSIGRLVATRLLELGDQPRALTRSPDRARRSLPAGVEIVAGDIADAASLTAALDGVEAVVMTHGAPYGSGDHAAVDYGAVPALLAARDGRQVQVALMTSIGVTGTGGSSRDLLSWKRRGERLLRASGLPYTVVRPGWFDAGTGAEQHIALRQGDLTEYGPVRREHVAEALVQALRTPQAIGRTLEVFSTEGAPVTDWRDAFAGTDPDRPGELDAAHDRPGPPLESEPDQVRADLRRHLHAADRTTHRASLSTVADGTNRNDQSEDDQMDQLKLNNDVQMPALGLGVFQTPPEETRAAVEAALKTGYRHIDTAAAYGNEREVGQAIRASGLDREEVFIETKIWISDYGYDQTLHGFEKSAGKLGVDRVDLLILHQALPSELDRTLEAYRALETLLEQGKVRAIGVSNFMVDHLERLLEKASVVPAVNQIELHPYFQQREVQALGAERGILTQAWSPIGGITFYRESDHRSTLEDPTIVAIAEAHGKSPAQVMLRWHLQEGRSVIPKSTKPHRIAENFDVFDFDLTADELAAIDALDTGRRGGPEPEAITLETFGREIPEA